MGTAWGGQDSPGRPPAPAVGSWDGRRWLTREVASVLPSQRRRLGVGHVNASAGFLDQSDEGVLNLRDWGQVRDGRYEDGRGSAFAQVVQCGKEPWWAGPTRLGRVVSVDAFHREVVPSGVADDRPVGRAGPILRRRPHIPDHGRHGRGPSSRVPNRPHRPGPPRGARNTPHHRNAGPPSDTGKDHPAAVTHVREPHIERMRQLSDWSMMPPPQNSSDCFWSPGQI